MTESNIFKAEKIIIQVINSYAKIIVYFFCMGINMKKILYGFYIIDDQLKREEEITSSARISLWGQPI